MFRTFLLSHTSVIFILFLQFYAFQSVNDSKTELNNGAKRRKFVKGDGKRSKTVHDDDDESS